LCALDVDLVVAPELLLNVCELVPQIVDGENGVLFPVGDDTKLSDAIVLVLKDESEGMVAVNGQSKAWNMFASNVSLSFGELLESILEFPSDADLPRPLDEAAKRLKGGWCWDMLFPTSVPFRESFQSRLKEPRTEKDDVGSGIIKILEDEWTLRNATEIVQNSTEIVGPRTVSVDLELPNTFDLKEATAIEEDVAAEKTEREEVRCKLHTFKMKLH
jgi:hypothetical protein